MKPEELDSTIDALESLRRIADAFLRDTSALADQLKRIQHRGGVAESVGDIYAYDEQLTRTLVHYGIPAGAVRESLHETLLTQYAQLHSIDPTALAGLLAKMRKPAPTPEQPSPAKAAEAFVMDSDAPTPTPLQESLLQLTDSMSRRAAVPKQLGELVAEYFSPAILRGGRGFIRPSSPPALDSYSEDLLQVGASRALKWPSGWYKHKTAADAPDQFFLTMRNWAILITDLSGGLAKGFVAKLTNDAGHVGEWVAYDELSRGESLALCSEVQTWFDGFSESKPA